MSFLSFLSMMVNDGQSKSVPSFLFQVPKVQEAWEVLANNVIPVNGAQ